MTDPPKDPPPEPHKGSHFLPAIPNPNEEKPPPFKPSSKRHLTGWGEACGAPTRNNHDNNNGVCQLPAGMGTAHSGSGRCKYHGGIAPAISGRYARIRKKELKTLIEEHELDPQPLNLLPDLAAGRAIFEAFIDMHETRWEALTAWHVAGGGEDARPPLAPPAIGEARKMLATIARLVKTCEEIRAVGAIPRSDFVRYMFELGRAVEANVRNKADKESLKRAWLSIRVGG